MAKPPFSTLPPLKDLLFGIELEGAWPWLPGINALRDARAAVAPILSAALGKPVHYCNNNKEWKPQAWVVTQDKTIYAEWPLFLDVEIKSPVMLGASLKKLPKTLRDIATTDLEPNDSCALHLHIGRAGQLALPRDERYTLWQPDEVVRFMQAFENNAESIYGLVDPHRRHNKHAMPNAKPDPARLEEIITNYRKYPESLDHMQLTLHNLYCPKINEQSFRDYAVNLGSLLSNGTIEVRLRQAAGFEHATPFIGVMLHMAQAAIDGRDFNWNDYTAAAANDPALRLSEAAVPTRPIQRPQFALAVSNQIY